MPKPDLGELELEVLQYLSDHPNVTVREAAQQFNTTHGLARTTILTVMENLRQKGYLTRKRGRSAFEYAPVVAKTDLLRGLMSDFVEKTLKGSVSTVVSFLTNTRRLSDEDLDELERLVEELREERRRKQP